MAVSAATMIFEPCLNQLLQQKLPEPEVVNPLRTLSTAGDGPRWPVLGLRHRGSGKKAFTRYSGKLLDFRGGLSGGK
jgi:hypothetical protein